MKITGYVIDIILKLPWYCFAFTNGICLKNYKCTIIRGSSQQTIIFEDKVGFCDTQSDFCTDGNTFFLDKLKVNALQGKLTQGLKVLIGAGGTCSPQFLIDLL